MSDALRVMNKVSEVSDQLSDSKPSVRWVRRVKSGEQDVRRSDALRVVN